MTPEIQTGAPRVYIDGVEVHGIRKASILIDNAAMQFEDAMVSMMPTIRELSLTFQSIHPILLRLMLGEKFNTAPPYKRNKHRYGR